MQILFALVVAAIIGFVTVQITLLPISWFTLILLFSCLVAVICVLVYAKKSLAFFFLCMYAFLLPLDISKALRLGEVGEGGAAMVWFISFADLWGFAMVGFYLFELFTKKIKFKPVSDVMVIYAIYIIWCLLSLMTALNPMFGITTALNNIKVVLFGIAAVNILNTKERLITVVLVMVGAVLLQSAYASIQAFTGAHLQLPGQKSTSIGRELFFGGAHGKLTRPTGTFHHPNVLGSYLVFVLPMFFGIIMMKEKYLAKYPAYIALGAGFIALLLSYSRGAWIGFSLALAIVVGLGLVKKMITAKALMSLVFACMVIAIAAFPLWQKVFMRITGPDDHATSVRIIMLKQAYMMVKDRPIFGVGSGNYFFASKKDTYLPRVGIDSGINVKWLTKQGFWVHNKYAAIAAETGIVGIMLFVLFQIKVLICAYRGICCRGRPLQYIALGLFAGIVGIYLNMMTDHFMDDVRHAVLWFTIALIMALRINFSEYKLKKSWFFTYS